MPHIHTEDGQHDFTASAFIVRLDTPEPALMLHKHKKLDQYLQFGGHVELHEHLWAALIHELREESGYDMSQLKVLQPAVRLEKLTGIALHPMPVCLVTLRFPGLNHYHTDIAFGFVTDQAPSGEIGAGESAIIKPFAAAELRALPSNQIPENVRETGLFVLDKACRDWQPVATDAWAKE